MKTEMEKLVARHMEERDKLRQEVANLRKERDALAKSHDMAIEGWDETRSRLSEVEKTLATLKGREADLEKAFELFARKHSEPKSVCVFDLEAVRCLDRYLSALEDAKTASEEVGRALGIKCGTIVNPVPYLRGLIREATNKAIDE